MRGQIEAAIQNAIEEVNVILPDSMRLNCSPDELVFGRGGKLDSLGLVNFIMSVETHLADRKLPISLTSERALSQTRSPFRSVRSLCDFIETELSSNHDA